MDHEPDRLLEGADLDPNPMVQFRRWFADAEATGLPLPNATALATADARGQPSARHVLLRAFDDRGFVFYTNHESRKGRELAANPHAAITIVWKELDRQVSAAGEVERVPEEESRAYFRTRPREARIGAWASRQSEVLGGREELEARFSEFDARYPGDDVPLPPFWGGFVLRPRTVEFWQGRPFRLHDRFRYALEPDGWKIDRLYP